MNPCPYCGTDWARHSVRCMGGVPAVDLQDDRGLSGRTISGYRIIGRIGEGGMGTVYLAWDNITEERLDAVKVLNRDLVVDRERMRREAVTANRVDHPNVCKIFNYVEAYDAESGETLTLIAMELVRGPTLREVQGQSGGTLELNRAARVVKEVASALQAVHQGGIIHRDIKPNNIIVTHDADGVERVKLVDFGIAKKEGGGEGQDLTEAGFVAATVHYASPEQLKGQAESRSDIYSLGVVFFELLTGRRPFEAANQAELYSLILDPTVAAPRLAQLRPDLGFPRPLQAILDRALARDPNKRYATALEFGDAVGGLVPDLEKTVVSPMTDFVLPASVPTVPSQSLAGVGGGVDREGSRGRQALRFWADRPGLLKALGAAAMVVLAAVLFVGLGGGEALRRVFSGEGGDGSDTLGAGGAVPGGGIVVPAGEDSLAGPDLRGPARIGLNRTELSLEPGQRRQLTAEVFDGSGNPLPMEAVTWTSSQESVASVDARGWVTGRSPGRATVTASAEEAVESVEVQVRQPQPSSDSSPGPVEGECQEPESALNPLLDGLMDTDRLADLEARRAVAEGCWGRSGLTENERALAAYSIGMIRWRMERIGGGRPESGCSQEVRGWFERALQLVRDDPVQRAIYDAALNGCRGDT